MTFDTAYAKLSVMTNHPTGLGEYTNLELQAELDSRMTNQPSNQDNIQAELREASNIAQQIVEDYNAWDAGKWDYSGLDPRQKGAEAITSHTNRQIEVVLDRLKKEFHKEHDSDTLSSIDLIIQAERQKLTIKEIK